MHRRARIVIAVAVLGTVAALTGLALAAPTPPPAGPPAATDPNVPSMPQQLGIGERLILVVGGVFETREQALAANAELSFGDVQGYYVVPVAQFEGLRERYPVGDWALVSAFRTEDAARGFAELAGILGVPATVLEQRVVSLGGFFAGLGQEAHPDGTGPLTVPVPASLPTPSPTEAP